MIKDLKIIFSKGGERLGSYPELGVKYNDETLPTLGWICTFKNEQYGDFLTFQKEVTISDLSDGLAVLSKQIIETLTELSKK